MIVDRLKVGNLFNFVADAGAIKNQKPAPDVFLVSAKNISVLPENCVGVEDAAAGIVAIKAAGMVAIGIGEPEILKGADMILPKTTNLTFERIQDVFTRVYLQKLDTV